ncbi:MAG: hypothetical protein KKC05_02630 [Nanoarchaeota archaeon]|nr:hypothetical protein [Nanoarchaeota archaeon]
MRGKILVAGLFILVAIAFAVSTSAQTGDPVSIQARMVEAQNALNVKAFDPASAVGTTFTDSVNPYTGALTITQTDVYLPGRNGMDVAITRQYSSNIFLNINQFANSQTDCGETNTVACNQKDPYTYCTTPEIITSKQLNNEGLPGGEVQRFMHRCESGTGVYQDSSSFSRPGILGLGWDMIFGKIKDPTPLLFETTSGIKHVTYDYVSARGVNSLSMTLNNNEEGLILPAMYNIPIGLTRDTEYTYWSNDVGGITGRINNFNDDITAAQNAHLGYDVNSFAAYTGDLSPVFLRYPTIEAFTSVSPGNPQVADGLGAIYYSKDGREYYFNWYVPFCSKYDDVFIPGKTSVNDCTSIHSLTKQEIGDIFNWAENPYAGLYLTGVKDSFGNAITYTYYGSGYDKSPFVHTITGPRSGATATFNYVTKDGSSAPGASYMDVDTKLKYITFLNPTGERPIYQIYQYRDPVYGNRLAGPYNEVDTCQRYLDSYDMPVICEQASYHNPYPPYNLIHQYYVTEVNSIPLLESTYLATDPGGSNEILGTRYTYYYDSDTRELTTVILPTGAEIWYEYSWAPDIPAYDILREYAPDAQKMTRRVISVRRVKKGGDCPPRNERLGNALPGGVESGGEWGGCAWVYQYKTIPETVTIDGNTRDHYELETTVHDPFGAKTVYNVYPTTVATLNYK